MGVLYEVENDLITFPVKLNIDNMIQSITTFHRRSLKVLITNREKEVLHLLAHGYTDCEIGTKLFLATSTIKSHRTNLLRKFDAKNSCHLVYLSLCKNDAI
jgi:DNA-binding NarL/FixJ family response regulator